MKQKLDNLVVGLLAGAILPMIGLYIYYLLTYRYQTSFTGFISYFTKIHVLVATLSVSCYASNLPLFFGFIWLKMNRAAQGVLYSTMGYTIWVIYEKFIA